MDPNIKLKGFIKASKISVRNIYDTKDDKLGKVLYTLNYRDWVDIYGTDLFNGKKWYHIKYTNSYKNVNIDGWVCVDFVQVSKGPNSNFETKPYMSTNDTNEPEKPNNISHVKKLTNKEWILNMRLKDFMAWLDEEHVED